MWDGSAAQVELIFRAGTDTTYPLLLNGSSVGRDYGLSYNQYVVVDHLGIVRYRTRPGAQLGTGFDEAAIRTAIAASLDDLAAAEEEEEEEEITAVLGAAAAPKAFALMGNFPNPFNAGTAIRFRLAEAGTVVLSVYDAQGRRVRRLWQGPLAAGTHHLSWDGRDEAGRAVATGVYVSHLATRDQAQAHKMLLLR